MGNSAFKCCTSPPAVMSPSHEGSPLPPIISSSSPSIPNTSSPPPSFDAFMLSIQQVNPTDQIDPLINFIEDQLRRIKAIPENASTSSSLLNSVASSTSLAATIVDTISTEAEKLGSTDIAKEMGSLALSGLKKVGEAHWLFLGLSVAAYALERGVTMRSNVSDCIDLLGAIVFLAKDLKRFEEVMPGESERLCQAVQIIVEGAIICCDYISKGGLSRKSRVKRTIRVPAISIKMADITPDEYSWRQYGQEPIKGSPHPRGYYKCSSVRGCLSRKHVERALDDPSMLIVTYEGEHNHSLSMSEITGLVVNT